MINCMTEERSAPLSWVMHCFIFDHDRKRFRIQRLYYDSLGVLQLFHCWTCGRLFQVEQIKSQSQVDEEFEWELLEEE